MHVSQICKMELKDTFKWVCSCKMGCSHTKKRIIKLNSTRPNTQVNARTNHLEKIVNCTNTTMESQLKHLYQGKLDFTALWIGTLIFSVAWLGTLFFTVPWLWTLGYVHTASLSAQFGFIAQIRCFCLAVHIIFKMWPESDSSVDWSRS